MSQLRCPLQWCPTASTPFLNICQTTCRFRKSKEQRAYPGVVKASCIVQRRPPKCVLVIDSCSTLCEPPLHTIDIANFCTSEYTVARRERADTSRSAVSYDTSKLID